MNTRTEDRPTGGEVGLTIPPLNQLGQVVQVLRDWQTDDAAWQLHPGDIGWFWRNGAEATVGAVRAWTKDGTIVAVGLLDGSSLLRLTTAPAVRHDDHLARRLVADISDPDMGVLPPGRVAVEAPADAALQLLLTEDGWATGEAFTPLHRDLGDEVEDPGIRVQEVTASEAEDWARVLRSAFGTLSPTRDRWQAMSGSFGYDHAVCLLGYDGEDPAAAVCVWSAGPGRPGLIEPMGVHESFRGRGLGRAITVSAAAALRAMGSSSAKVYTQSSNVGGIATYQGAGFTALAPVRDRLRCT